MNELYKEPAYVRTFVTDPRDGEQTAGVHFSLEDKIALALGVEAVGADIVEAGFAAAGPEDFAAVRAVAIETSRIVVCSLARLKEADVDRAGEALDPAIQEGRGRIHVFGGGSPQHMKKNKQTPEEVVEATANAVSHASTITSDVEFSVEDATRTNHDLLMYMCETAVAHGATTINIPDTVGISLPSEYGKLFSWIVPRMRKLNPDVVVSAHCHDDLGNASSNSLAAIQHGARQVEGVFGEIGERAGNAKLEVIVANLDIRNDKAFRYRGKAIQHGIDSSGLYGVCRMVSELSGYPTSPTSPIIGANVHTDVGGTHQHGVRKDWSAYHILPKGYGGHPGPMESIGKLSGGSGVAGRLEALSLVADEKSLRSITNAVKAEANAERREILDNEIESIAARILGIELVDDIELIDWTITSGPKLTVGEVKIMDKNQGVERSGKCKGVGGIDSLAKATNLAMGFVGDIDHLDTHSIKSGSAGMAGTKVVITQNGRTVRVYAESDNVVGMGIDGYITAINMIRRASRRKQANT